MYICWTRLQHCFVFVAENETGSLGLSRDTTSLAENGGNTVDSMDYYFCQKDARKLNLDYERNRWIVPFGTRSPNKSGWTFIIFLASTTTETNNVYHDAAITCFPIDGGLGHSFYSSSSVCSVGCCCFHPIFPFGHVFG